MARRRKGFFGPSTGQAKFCPCERCFEFLKLSASRYHTWKRAIDNDCSLDDISTCPKIQPTQLTPDEIRTMREMVTAPEYRHVSTSRLALLAERLEKLFASPSTWILYARTRQWRRPRNRIHPEKPLVGLRCSSPNETWHIDTTVFRLLDGTKAYLQAVIDNDSRRFLA
jgi:hypothetical protein